MNLEVLWPVPARTASPTSFGRKNANLIRFRKSYTIVMVKKASTDYEGIAIIVATCSMFFLWSVVSVAYPFSSMVG